MSLATESNGTVKDEVVAEKISVLQEPPTATNGDATDSSPPTVVTQPFSHPTSSSRPKPAAALTAEQSSKYEDLLKNVKTWTEVPDTSAASASKSLIKESEQMWLTRDCLLRYLRASKWVTATAATRLKATLTWRREWGLEKHTPEYVAPESETGKQVILGFDMHGRPCLYLNPHKQNTQKSERQLHHLTFSLERCIDLMPPGQETIAILINFAQTARGQGASPAQGIQVTNILQNHYPERLGISIIQQPAWYIKLFFKAIGPFLDPTTREKMRFDEEFSTLVPREQLLKEYGGEVDFEYVHEKYWPAMVELAATRRKEMVERWASAGKQVGESEAYLKGDGPAIGADGDIPSTNDGNVSKEDPSLSATA